MIYDFPAGLDVFDLAQHPLRVMDDVPIEEVKSTDLTSSKVKPVDLTSSKVKSVDLTSSKPPGMIDTIAEEEVESEHVTSYLPKKKKSSA